MRPKKPSGKAGKDFGKSRRPYPAKPSGKPQGKSQGKPYGKPEKKRLSPAAFTPNPRPDTRPQSSSSGSKPSAGGLWLYGLHAVAAALANPRRRLGRAVLTPRAQETLDSKLLARVPVETLDPGGIDRLLPAGAVHQGAALEAWPLKSRDLDEILAESAPDSEGKRRVILVLDQLSDPHNVGAILRTAAAFGVTAVIVQDRNAPPQSGALAKAASGALDLIPYVEVVNIARTLDQLAEKGFWRIALAGDGEQSLAEAAPSGDVALVLGSEGAGIRRLVREHCEAAAFIPIAKDVESLNVSNAAAIALYELNRA